MITLSSGTNVLVLPENLCWADEFKWTPVSQAVDIALSGAVVIQESVQIAGRPITLTTPDGGAWIKRSDLITLQAWEFTPGFIGMLTLNDGRVFSVTFRRVSNTNSSSTGYAAAVSADPVFASNTSDADDEFAVTINLMTTS